MNRREFFQKTGRLPEQDDLERVNCDKVGQHGHWTCGWCEACDGPKFECGCGLPWKETPNAHRWAV